MRGNKGFSLAEVMIAAGMLGALSLVMMNISREGVVVQKRSETAFEINSISNIITQVLLHTDACSSTLGVGTPIANGKNITQIINRSGNPIYETNTKYGNNAVQINSMTLRDLTLAGNPGDPQRSGEVNLAVTFEKLSKAIKGQKTVTKNYFLNVQVDASDNLVKCHSAIENAVATAKQITCESVGGTFDVANDVCNLTDHPAGTPIAGERHKAVSNSFLQNTITNDLDPKYVDVAGDTMTGKLQVNADIESSNQVCVDGRCRNFNQSPCPTGQVVRSINADGTAECANVTCPNSNTFYVGVDASGNPICKAFPTNTCSANQYVSQVNADGSVVCSQLPPGTNQTCPSGVVQGVNADGTLNCVDSVPDDKNVYSKSCLPGQVVTGFDSDGNAICTNSGVSNVSCPAGEAITSFDASGNITCEKLGIQPLGYICPSLSPLSYCSQYITVCPPSQQCTQQCSQYTSCPEDCNGQNTPSQTTCTRRSGNGCGTVDVRPCTPYF